MVGGGALPYDAEVEYLETTGTQYVNTGFYYLGRYRFKIVVKLKSLSSSSDSSSASLIGARKDNISQMIQVSTWQNGTFGYNNKLLRPNAINQINVEYTIEHRSDNGFYVNGVKKRTVNTVDFTSIYPVCICGIALGNSADVPRYSELMIGYFKLFEIYDGAETLKRYIPVRVGNVGYIYEEIDKDMFRSNGTEDFIPGNDVNT